MLARAPPPRAAGETRVWKGAGLWGHRERQSGGPARRTALPRRSLPGTGDAELKGHASEKRELGAGGAAPALPLQPGSTHL